MTTDTRGRRLMFLENLTHYLTAMVVILKGFDKLSAPGKAWIGTLFLLFGLFIVFGTIFHHKLEKTLKHFKAYVMVCEAIVMAVVGYLYMAEGKTAIQYVCFAASFMFVVAVIVYIRNRNKVKVHA